MEATGAYSKFLDDFGSEIGATLEDLATEWGESEYDFADDLPATTFVLEESGSLHRESMDSIPGIADWSLKKAKPLAFSNPVYHLLTNGGVVSKPHQMKLIPLNQFEINKNQDSKKSKKGIKAKLSNLSIRRSNSTKKHESEMHVTAPLWTDAPTAIPSEPRIRSRSLLTRSNTDSFDERDEIAETKTRPDQLDLSTSTESLKPPPVKTPRTSKGNFSPFEAPAPLFGDIGAVETSQSEPEQASKTMLEVLNEMGEENETPPVSNVIVEDTTEKQEPRLKRNKTVKWSGSRAAPTLIREFTRKSKKQSNQTEAPAEAFELPTIESPAKCVETNSQAPKPETPKRPSPTPKKRDSSAYTLLSSLLPPAPKLRRTESTKIRAYIHKMGSNSQNALGFATTEFVKQTMQSTECRPLVILHSVRSFLTDIKKYLVTNPHVGFMSKIQKMSVPINDIEGAIDDALERLVLYPLRDFIYKRLVLSYAQSGKIRMVEDAIQIGASKSPKELGIRDSLTPPDEEALESIRVHFQNLQSTYSPYHKLKHLLSAVTTIYENTYDETCPDRSARRIGADDFLPLLVYSITKCNFAAADIEAQYIDGLLDPALLLGEGGYYLTTLISAVQVLSRFKKREEPLPLITDLQGFLKVAISPKTDADILMHKTLHVPPSMTASSLGSMIAKKFAVKQHANFCLHVVVNNVAYPLKPHEFPQLVKMDLLTQFSPKTFYFVYRQLDSDTGIKEKSIPASKDSTEDSEGASENVIVMSAKQDSDATSTPVANVENTIEKECTSGEELPNRQTETSSLSESTKLQLESTISSTLTPQPESPSTLSESATLPPETSSTTSLSAPIRSDSCTVLEAHVESTSTLPDPPQPEPSTSSTLTPEPDTPAILPTPQPESASSFSDTPLFDTAPMSDTEELPEPPQPESQSTLSESPTPLPEFPQPDSLHHESHSTSLPPPPQTDSDTSLDSPSYPESPTSDSLSTMPPPTQYESPQPETSASALNPAQLDIPDFFPPPEPESPTTLDAPLQPESLSDLDFTPQPEAFTSLPSPPRPDSPTTLDSTSPPESPSALPNPSQLNASTSLHAPHQAYTVPISRTNRESPTRTSPAHLSSTVDTSDGEILSDDESWNESYLQATRVDDFSSPAKKTLSSYHPTERKSSLATVQDGGEPRKSYPDAHSSHIDNDGLSTSVSVLKNYFESEIDKVTKQTTKKSPK